MSDINLNDDYLKDMMSLNDTVESDRAKTPASSSSGVPYVNKSEIDNMFENKGTYDQYGGIVYQDLSKEEITSKLSSIEEQLRQAAETKKNTEIARKEAELEQKKQQEVNSSARSEVEKLEAIARSHAARAAAAEAALNKAKADHEDAKEKAAQAKEKAEKARTDYEEMLRQQEAEKLKQQEAEKLKQQEAEKSDAVCVEDKTEEKAEEKTETAENTDVTDDFREVTEEKTEVVEEKAEATEEEKKTVEAEKTESTEEKAVDSEVNEKTSVIEEHKTDGLAHETECSAGDAIDYKESSEYYTDMDDLKAESEKLQLKEDETEVTKSVDSEVNKSVDPENNFCEVEPENFCEVTPEDHDIMIKNEAGNNVIPLRLTPDVVAGTGLVLAGGGGKGIYQVGMLMALEKAGYLNDITAISGVSIGAVNTVLYSMGLDKMEKIWDEIDMSVLFDFDEKMLGRGELHFSRSEMLTLIEKYLDYDLISGNERVLYCGTSKLPKGYTDTMDPWDVCVPEYFQLNAAINEDIKKILLASTAMPYIYSPVSFRDNYYLDGGINDNIPVKPLYDLGIRRFIVIELTKESKLDQSRFPGAEIIDICPSHDLGSLVQGTLNFEAKDKRFKKELGKRDGERYIHTLFEKDESYIAIESALAEREYQILKNECMHADKADALAESVNSNLDKFNSIYNTFKDF